MSLTGLNQYTKQGLMCLAQGHKAVMLVRLEPATPQSPVKHSTLSHCSPYTIRVLNSLNPDQDRHSVGPDLGQNCLQRLSANDKSCLARKELFYMNF